MKFIMTVRGGIVITRPWIQKNMPMRLLPLINYLFLHSFTL